MTFASAPIMPLVLVVGDDASSRDALVRLLVLEGYEAATAPDGEAGLRALPDGGFDAVVVDLRRSSTGGAMVGGREFCRRARRDPRLAALPVLLVSDRSDMAAIAAGLAAGADDYVGRPFHQPEVMARLRSVLRLRQVMVRNETAQSVVAALANAVEAKDGTTQDHCQRLASRAVLLADRVGLASEVERDGIIFGALLHDVGKIGISEAILRKPGPLTEEEWLEIRRHPEIGERICRPLDAARLFAPILRHHHEHWDGTGYPDRLRGADIPLGARIVGVVDAFDAMTHERPYSRALSVDQALEELRRGAGRQFDPDLVAVFLGLLHQELSDPDSAPHATAIPVARVIDIPRLTVGTVRTAGTDAVGEPIGP